MPDDFRSQLYATYVSSFKSHTSSAPSSEWWNYKYLPLLAELPSSADILEIGCGDGALLAYLDAQGFTNIRGIDISPEQVAAAQRRGVTATCADAVTYLSQLESTQDAIIAVDLLEHLTRDELLHLAHRMFGALQPGGRLLLQTANGAGLFPGQVIYGDLTHQTVFTPASLAQLLSQAGFSNLSFFETGPIPIRIRGKLNVAAWSAIKLVANAVRYVETGKRQAIWTENFICLGFKPA